MEGVRGRAVFSKTSPCWTDREVVPAADQDFPKGSCAHHGCWAHTKWIRNEKSVSQKLAFLQRGCCIDVGNSPSHKGSGSRSRDGVGRALSGSPIDSTWSCNALLVEVPLARARSRCRSVLSTITREKRRSVY